MPLVASLRESTRPPSSPDGGYDPDLSMNINSFDGISGIIMDAGFWRVLGWSIHFLCCNQQTPLRHVCTYIRGHGSPDHHSVKLYTGI